jgi:hypothetical protein
MLLGFPALSIQLYDTAATREKLPRGEEEEKLDELEDMLKEYRDTLPHGHDPAKDPADTGAHKFAPLGALEYRYFSGLPPPWIWCLLLIDGEHRDRKANFEAMAAEMCESSIHDFRRSVIRLLTSFQIPLSILPSETER